MQPSVPFLTAEIPSIPVAIRRHLADFQVEELPLYEPCGSGDHVYVWIEKRRLTTRQAVLELAQALGVAPSKIGHAGRKDARGVTRQMLSVEGVELERVRSLRLPHLHVIEVARHRTKLRPGALRGNRFTVRLREVPRGRLDEVQIILDRLAQRGVPNYFGAQRFGMRGDTWEVGRALLAGDFTAAIGFVVGQPLPNDPALVRRARELAAAGQYREAARAWPQGFADCRHLCRLMDERNGDARQAIFGLDRTVLGFYVSAYQAWLFNCVVAERLPNLDRILSGDIVFVHRTGRCTRVTDLAAEQSRAVRFDLSPTGPIVGFSMSVPRDEAGALEQEVLAEADCAPETLPRSGPLRCVGARRPLRVPLEQVGMNCATDETGPYIELRFALPPGSYATAVLREIGKDLLEEGSPDREDD